MTATTCSPRTEALPWDPAIGALVCPACPDHSVTSDDDRYEVCLEGDGLDGREDHQDALSIVRRYPGLLSGPFDVPPLPEGMPALAVIDYLERQTFDAADARRLAASLGRRFAMAVVHVWVPADCTARIAEDTYWDEDERQLVRTPAFDIAPPEYGMDIGWRFTPDHVSGPDDRTVTLWRGCLYVDLERPELVRYAWRDFPERHPAGAG